LRGHLVDRHGVKAFFRQQAIDRMDDCILTHLQHALLKRQLDRDNRVHRRMLAEVGKF